MNPAEKISVFRQLFLQSVKLFALKNFKTLIEDGVECYILNTGEFMGKKVQPEHTLGIIESIIEGKATFEQWGNLSEVETINLAGFEANLDDEDYKNQVIARLHDRLNFIKSRETEKGGIDNLTPDAAESIEKLIAEINNKVIA